MYEAQPTSQSSTHPAPSPLSGPTDRRQIKRGAYLPLEARAEPVTGGWAVRLPVRAEEIRIDRQAVVIEQVVVRAETVEEMVRLEAPVRHEELRVAAEGDLEVQSPDVRPAVDPLERTVQAQRPPNWPAFPNTPR